MADQVHFEKLEVFKRYRAFIEGGEVCEDIVFDDEEFTFTVLKKPNRVIAVSIDENGLDEEEEDLPEHLARPDWYLIRKDGSKEPSWFNAKHVKVTEEPDFEKVEFYLEEKGVHSVKYSHSGSINDDLSGCYYQSADVDHLVQNLREEIHNLREQIRVLSDNK